MTNSLKYGLIALAGITLLFLYNKSSQKSYTLKAETIFDGKSEIINRIVISENEQILELVKNDSIWSITGNDSFVVTISKIDNIFDKVLNVRKEMLITSKEEKWSKFGVDDSLGKHFSIYDQSNNELGHYIFGNSGQDYQHNYIRKNQTSDVYRTDNNIYYLLNSSDSYWGSVPKKKNEVEPR